MQKHAILVNVSHGAVADERALYTALCEGRIAGTRQEVTEEQPIVTDRPLSALANLLITPHSAAHSNLRPHSFWAATPRAIIVLAHGRWPDSVMNRKQVVPVLPPR